MVLFLKLPQNNGLTSSAKPIKAMGFFKHHACAIDPRTSIVYLTENNFSNSGFYRFIPRDMSKSFGSLENGGKLQILKVSKNLNADLRSAKQGEIFPVEWITVENPDQDPEFFQSPNEDLPEILGKGKSGCYLQGEAKGAARFSSLKGAWYQNGVIYFTDSSADDSNSGIVWVYIQTAQGNFIQVIYSSPKNSPSGSPSNIILSPRNGILFLSKYQ